MKDYAHDRYVAVFDKTRELVPRLHQLTLIASLGSAARHPSLAQAASKLFELSREALGAAATATRATQLTWEAEVNHRFADAEYLERKAPELLRQIVEALRKLHQQLLDIDDGVIGVERSFPAHSLIALFLPVTDSLVSLLDFFPATVDQDKGETP